MTCKFGGTSALCWSKLEGFYNKQNDVLFIKTMLEKKQHGNLQILSASSWLAKKFNCDFKIVKTTPKFPILQASWQWICCIFQPVNGLG